MIKPEQRIPVGARVRLRDGVDPSFYGGFSRTGNEGWVRKRRLDKYEYPLVLIQWDHDHWSYNGAQDCWTHENHFDIVEGPVDEDRKQAEDAIRNATETFTQSILDAIGKGAPEEPPESAEESADGWGERIDEATKDLRSAKAFLVLAIHEQGEDEEFPGLINPVVFQNARDENSALVCQHQLVHLVTALHDSLIAETMQKTKGDQSDSES